MNKCNPRAFTLLESLVGIAIIVILAVLLVPQAWRILENSHESRCISNLRAIGVVVHLYAADNNMNLPPGNSDGSEWFKLNNKECWLKEYGPDGTEEAAKRLLRCPSDKTPRMDTPFAAYQYYYSYGWNVELLLAYVDGAPAHGRSPVKLAQAQRKILFADGISHAENPAQVAKYPESISKNRPSYGISSRHHGGANALFGDGSVSWVSPNDLLLPLILRD